MQICSTIAHACKSAHHNDLSNIWVVRTRRNSYRNLDIFDRDNLAGQLRKVNSNFCDSIHACIADVSEVSIDIGQRECIESKLRTQQGGVLK